MSVEGVQIHTRREDALLVNKKEGTYVVYDGAGGSGDGGKTTWEAVKREIQKPTRIFPKCPDILYGNVLAAATDELGGENSTNSSYGTLVLLDLNTQEITHFGDAGAIQFRYCPDADRVIAEALCLPNNICEDDKRKRDGLRAHESSFQDPEYPPRSYTFPWLRRSNELITYLGTSGQNGRDAELEEYIRNHPEQFTQPINTQDPNILFWMLYTDGLVKPVSPQKKNSFTAFRTPVTLHELERMVIDSHSDPETIHAALHSMFHGYDVLDDVTALFVKNPNADFKQLDQNTSKPHHRQLFPFERATCKISPLNYLRDWRIAGLFFTLLSLQLVPDDALGDITLRIGQNDRNHTTPTITRSYADDGDAPPPGYGYEGLFSRQYGGSVSDEFAATTCNVNPELGDKCINIRDEEGNLIGQLLQKTYISVYWGNTININGIEYVYVSAIVYDKDDNPQEVFGYMATYIEDIRTIE